MKNAISLFSGMGGDSLGLKLAGYNVIAYSEIEKHFRVSHDLNFPESKLLGESVNSNIKNISDNELLELKTIEDFLDFMNNRIALSETRRVLIFGPELKFWLLSDKHIALIKKGRCNLDGGAYVAVLPSLAKMLHNLELKRQAWEVLRARPDLGQAAFTLS